MYFTTDEINKNPYLLPNMSLMFSIMFELCKNTLWVLDVLHTQEKMRGYFINYICSTSADCFVYLTGPSWKTSLKLAVHTRESKVRMCDT